ncbi:hypothetical protein FIBSPDRAFT_783504 [Athelia psychrophila]|uniref:IMD domain-containing protein n=1 Tax=Athelia psychrophila TaxID=1759441 RepID=A0A166NK53_9AGAM|nr:hypothetical protein FIBSPDRAFT_783504 [Fibularhizoctonia sp. CBS 109695]
MASDPSQDLLYERAEIHKSCKSFETVINTLNDYCEAAGSMLALQKKLARALRETASLRVTGAIPANALSASANIFDIMSDIDGKFGKIADKECDSISSEVKKWFKKLAKEEKVHDERISNANARIKQAGQTYERKSKRNARDAGDDHSRYINLISTLGPEISQEKHNHALSVSKKHTLATHNVAACLSRIADAEWTRSCEHVRRFSPVVGHLNEWRMYCEGGWNGSVPRDLPNLGESGEANDDAEPSPSEAQQLQRTVTFTEEGRDRRESLENLALRMPAKPSSEPFLSRKPSASASSSAAGHSPNLASARPTLEPPKPAFSSNPSNENWADTVGSVTSLSSFPSPPSYVPSPPEQEQDSPRHPQARASPVPVQPSQQASASSSRLPPLSESPQPLQSDWPADEKSASRGAAWPVDAPPSSKPASTAVSQETAHATTGHGGSSGEHRSPSRVPVDYRDNSPGTTGHGDGLDRSNHSIVTGDVPSRQPQIDPRASPSRTRRPSLDAFRSSPGDPGQESPINRRRGDSLANELGGNRNAKPEQPANETQSPKRVERNASTMSTGSVVAAIRTKYTSAAGSSSPPPRDVPRLPLSVNNLASRYQPTDGPVSPRRRAVSPTEERSPRTLEVHSPRPSPYGQEKNPDGGFVRFPSPSTEANMEELTRLRRLREQAEQEQKLSEQALRTREIQLEIRTRELEQDRAQFLQSRNDGYSNSSGDDSFRPPENNNASNAQRRYSQLEPPYSPPVISRDRHSYSTTHLVPPSSSSSHLPSSRYQSQPSSPVEPTRTSSSGHADFCGCATCSAAKYRMRSTPSPHDLRPPEPPITLRPEKPKGWMRRLSMPVGNAFSLDSKKSNSSLRTPAAEDGRMKKSFEHGGISNRSVGNLNLGRR